MSLRISMDTVASKAKSWIESHLKDIKGIHDVATGLRVSTETLRKDSVRVEGISISEFIRRRSLAADYFDNSVTLRAWSLYTMVLGFELRFQPWAGRR